MKKEEPVYLRFKKKKKNEMKLGYFLCQNTQNV